MSRKEEFKKELVNLLQQCVDEGLTVYFHKVLTIKNNRYGKFILWLCR